MAGKTRLEGKNAEIALKLLHDVTIELEKAGISYWLEGGTLLGIIRENRLLPWDNDMDISMYIQDRWKLLKAVMKLVFKGYRITVKSHPVTIGPFRKGELRLIKIRNFERFLRKGEIMLDIFLKKKVEDQFFWMVNVKTPTLKSVPARFYDELGWVEFNGKKYMIPNDFDGYLSYRYGDWKTPVKSWNYIVDDKAIVQNKDKK